MPNLLLRRHAVVKAYPDEYLVIMWMADGFELEVGHISKQTSAHQAAYWQWAGPGITGRSQTRQEAMAALKAAWSATEEDLAALRRDQEATQWKYELWAAGHKDLSREIPCPCGEVFDPGIHEQTAAHIEHFKQKRPHP